MNCNIELVSALKKWRLQEAVANKIPAYMIMSNKAIDSIAMHHPGCLGNLALLQGIGDKTVDKYGKDILAIVDQFPGSDTTPQPKDERWEHISSLIQEFDQMGVTPDTETAMRLNDWRDMVAQSIGGSYFDVFSDKLLVNLSLYRPLTLKALEKVPGVKQNKIETYGLDIISVIKGS